MGTMTMVHQPTPELPAGLEIAFKDLPRPVGYRMLVYPKKIEEVSEGGIVFADQTQEANKHLNYYGIVLAMGEACYHDERLRIGGRYNPWCKPGDWVLFGQYKGQKVKMRDRKGQSVELLLLNDDEIRAVAPNPALLQAYI